MKGEEEAEEGEEEEEALLPPPPPFATNLEGSSVDYRKEGGEREEERKE